MNNVSCRTVLKTLTIQNKKLERVAAPQQFLDLCKDRWTYDSTENCCLRRDHYYDPKTKTPFWGWPVVVRWTATDKVQAASRCQQDSGTNSLQCLQNYLHQLHAPMAPESRTVIMKKWCPNRGIKWQRKFEKLCIEVHCWCTTRLPCTSPS